MATLHVRTHTARMAARAALNTIARAASCRSSVTSGTSVTSVTPRILPSPLAAHSNALPWPARARQSRTIVACLGLLLVLSSLTSARLIARIRGLQHDLAIARAEAAKVIFMPVQQPMPVYVANPAGDDGVALATAASSPSASSFTSPFPSPALLPAIAGRNTVQLDALPSLVTDVTDVTAALPSLAEAGQGAPSASATAASWPADVAASHMEGGRSRGRLQWRSAVGGDGRQSGRGAGGAPTAPPSQPQQAEPQVCTCYHSHLC